MNARVGKRVVSIDVHALAACAAILVVCLTFPPSLAVALGSSAVILAAGVAEYRKRR